MNRWIPVAYSFAAGATLSVSAGGRAIIAHNWRAFAILAVVSSGCLAVAVLATLMPPEPKP